MKDITTFLNEAKEFHPEDIVAVYNNNNPLLDFLADETEKDRKDFTISMDGVKYKKLLVPGTKLSQKLTGNQILDLVFNYLIYKNELDKKLASKPTKYKKIGKNKEISWLKLTKGGPESREKLDARRNAENARIAKGLPHDDDIYKG